MADTHDEERQDPVLVRPYIRTEPGGAVAAGHDDRPEETWPAPAPVPAEEAAATGPTGQPALPEEAQGRTSVLLRQRLIVLSGVGVLALVGAGLVIAGSGDDPAPRRPPEAQPALPAPAATGSLGAGPDASEAARPPTSPGRSARATSQAPDRPAATTGGAATPGAQNPAPPAPTSAAPPSATLAPPPDTDRTGAITSAGGRCLALGGLLGLDGSPVQVAGCSGSGAQTFTLATDGTLRVAGRCAQVTGEGEVRSIGCDARESAQWRAGPNGSLVNPATGRCLTDPGTSGATARAGACTGAADQRWTLP